MCNCNYIELEKIVVRLLLLIYSIKYSHILHANLVSLPLNKILAHHHE
jgi:hypothetical protein